MLRLLRRFGIVAEELEDAAQEVFLTVHRRLPQYDASRGTIRTWLFVLARGVAANRRRSTKRRLRVVAPPQEGRTEETPERKTQRRQVLELVEAFLQGLPLPQREVFELIDIEGLRGPEVSELLDVKLGTVYTRLRTARQAFKAYVAQIDSDVGGAR